MSELQVPDFNTLDDFTNWVKKLEDKEIQSWTTKDWLKMYDKLEAYTASEAFTKVYEQKIPELISSGKLAGTVENWLSYVSDPLSRKQLFVQVETLDMVKLYRNFRFEPEQSKYIRDIARKAGEKLADTGVSTAKFSIPSNNLDKRERDLIDVAHSANDIVRKSTAYEKMGNEAMLNTMVEVDDMILGGGDASPISKGLSRMRLNSLKQGDATVQMVFHEAAHLHFQTQNPLQQDLFTQQNITAHPELGTDFQKLMDKNRQFYLHPTSIEKDLEVLAGMPYEEYKKVYRKALRGYRSEPMERYSYIYGQEAERAYRRASGYYSERTAMKIADRIATPLISGTINVGRPEQVRHTEKGIELTYKSYDTEPEKLEKAIKAKFAHADETLLRDIDIKANKLFGEVKITVPNSYDFTSRYNKYVTTPPPPPPPPPVINAKNEFPSSLPGNVEASSIENSTLKKVRTTEGKSAGVDAGLSAGEKAEQATAKTATKSALENQAKETTKTATKTALGEQAKIAEQIVQAQSIVPDFKTVEEASEWIKKQPELDIRTISIYNAKTDKLEDMERGLLHTEHYSPAELTDDFWKEHALLGNNDYAAEVNKMLPDNQFGDVPSVSEIKKWVEEDILYNYVSIESPTSIPLAEKQLGFKIGGDYKFPNGMTNEQYAIQRFIKYGGADTGPFEDFKLKQLQANSTKREAYVEAWKRLHYNQKDLTEGLKKDFEELCKLNPELKQIKATSVTDLWRALDGAIYDFPAGDIKNFVQNSYKDENIWQNKRCAMSQSVKPIFEVECMEAGVKVPNLQWVPCESTRKKIIAQLQQKEEFKLPKSVIKKDGFFVSYIDSATGETLLEAKHLDYWVATKQKDKMLPEVWEAYQEDIPPKRLDAEQTMTQTAVTQTTEEIQEKTATKTALGEQAKETERATTKAATKATLKTQAANAAKKGGKTVSQATNSIGKAALEANAKFDATVDKVIEKGTQKLNNSKVGKAYNKIAANAAQTKVGKAVAKTASKAVEKAAASTAGKAVGKVVAKTVGTAVGKSVLKKIPLVSAGAGAYFAYERIKNGEWKAAGCEMLSGIAGCFPGLGTAASVAIDTGLAANDIHNAIKENNKQTAQAETKTSTKTQTAKKVAPKDLSKQIAERTEAKKKVTQKTTLSSKQMAQAQQNSRA